MTRAFLDEPRDAILATVNPDGSPHLTVVWYERAGDEICINTTADRVKPRNLARDPRVSLLVGDGRKHVRIEGTARVISTRAEALSGIHRLAVRYDGEEKADRDVRELYSKHERVGYAIRVSRVYVKERS